ncbi:hypothetical protein N7535_003782 [Penicillium sp. DV-2018c]|nr:hypothetical protein N7461_000518 [Penicillium sp. DV-2018c]KAJ5576856.1 hypothetical protein N7535_003782 [Penicillium sp. DV-2018c]
MTESLHNTLLIDSQWPVFSIRYLFGILAVALGAGIWKIRQYHKARASRKVQASFSDNKLQPITPLEGFDWEKTEPIQFRPFKGKEKYNLTMAIENLDPSEFLPIDKLYKDRIAVRKTLVQQHHDVVIGVNHNETPQQDPRVRPAVSELYTYLLKTYLPARYPTMFSLNADGTMFHNLVTDEYWPTTVSPTTKTTRALEIIAQTVEDDFLILLPEVESEDGEVPKYVLQAYATCFPSGFNSRKKLGLRLVDIHKPVPSYKEKMELSMDRFFSRLEVGKYVKRINWSVTIDAGLFAAFGGTHAMENGKKEDPIEAGKLDVDKTVLRCERQTLHRMPVSKAIVFTVHTYRYPIQQIKDEGLGEELATAVEGLKKGNAPGMHFYKKGDVWGEALKDFLRS